MKRNFTAALVLFSMTWVLSAWAKPTRIVSLELPTDNLVLELASPENILAVSSGTHQEAFSMRAEQAKRHKAIERPAAETLYALQPDLVIFGTWGSRQSYDMLKQLGIRVHRTRYSQSWQDIFENIKELGELLGEPERAQTLIKSMRTRLEELEQKVSGLPKKRALYCIGKIHTFGKNSVYDDMMRSAGVINIAAQAGLEGLGQLSIEEVVLAQPDILIFSDYHKDSPSLSRELLNHPAFKKLSTRTTILELPARKLNGIDNYLVDCAEALAKTAHPQAFQP